MIVGPKNLKQKYLNHQENIFSDVFIKFRSIIFNIWLKESCITMKNMFFCKFETLRLMKLREDTVEYSNFTLPDTCMPCKIYGQSKNAQTMIFKSLELVWLVDRDVTGALTA